MPTFREYVEVEAEAEIEVSPEEFIEKADIEEKRELYELLIKDEKKNHFLKQSGFHVAKTLGETLFENALQKLNNNYVSLSNEDEETILKIAKKF